MSPSHRAVLLALTLIPATSASCASSSNSNGKDTAEPSSPSGTDSASPSGDTGRGPTGEGQSDSGAETSAPTITGSDTGTGSGVDTGADTGYDWGTELPSVVPCTLPPAGCCLDNTLYYCNDGPLDWVDCKLNPTSSEHPAGDKCGWSAKDSYFDCDGRDTAATDIQMDCPSDVAGADPRCKDMPLAGCCVGDHLYYCEQFVLRTISCGENPDSDTSDSDPALTVCGYKSEFKSFDCGGVDEVPADVIASCPASIR